jgi:phytoene desaturase
MADEVERVCGPKEAQGYLRYVDFVSQLYRYEMKDFIDRNIDSPLDLITPNLARLVAIGGFRKLAPKVEQYLRDPRTQRVLSFQSMYAGLSPYDALAIYAVIAYMDSVAGVYFPKGGMHAVPGRWPAPPRSTASSSATGRRSPGSSSSTAALWASRRPTASGSPPTSWSSTPTCRWPTASCCHPRRPRGGSRRSTTRRPASCCSAGSTQGYSQIAHHNIHFGKSWAGVFDELIDQKTLMSDPSILVTNPSRSDPSLAPGRQAHLLRAAAHAEHQRPDRLGRRRPALPRRGGGPARGDGLRRLRRRHRGRGRHDARRLAAPRHGAGRPFAAAHSFLQTGPVPARPTWRRRSRAWSSPAPAPSRASACRWCWSPAAGRGAILGKDKGYRSRAMRLAQPSPVLQAPS